MSKVTVARPQKILSPFSKAKILINGDECEFVKAGKTVTFDLPADARDIQVVLMGLPPTNSNLIQFSQPDGDMTFEIKISAPVPGSDTIVELIRK